MMKQIALWWLLVALVVLVVRLLVAVKPFVVRGIAALAVVFAVVLLSARPAHADPMPTRTKLALGCFVVGSYWDAVNTAYAVARGTGHEANPVFRPLVRSRGIVVTMTVKGAANAGLAAAVASDDRRGHARRAFWSALGLCGGQSVANILNARALGGGRN